MLALLRTSAVMITFWLAATAWAYLYQGVAIYRALAGATDESFIFGLIYMLFLATRQSLSIPRIEAFMAVFAFALALGEVSYPDAKNVIGIIVGQTGFALGFAFLAALRTTRNQATEPFIWLFVAACPVLSQLIGIPVYWLRYRKRSVVG